MRRSNRALRACLVSAPSTVVTKSPGGSPGEPALALPSPHDRSWQHRGPARPRSPAARVLPTLRPMGGPAAGRDDRRRPGRAPAAVLGALPPVRRRRTVAGAAAGADSRPAPGRMDGAAAVSGEPYRAPGASRAPSGVPSASAARCTSPAQSCAAARGSVSDIRYATPGRKANGPLRGRSSGNDNRN
jgi:hypothetical protein